MLDVYLSQVGLVPALTLMHYVRLGAFKVTVVGPTGLHTQKAYTHTGTPSPQILMLSACAYTVMHEQIWYTHWLKEVPV